MYDGWEAAHSTDFLKSAGISSSHKRIDVTVKVAIYEVSGWRYEEISACSLDFSGTFNPTMVDTKA
jgi:hypothetical protein